MVRKSVWATWLLGSWLACVATMAAAQATRYESLVQPNSSVVDNARMFSEDAIRRAQNELAALEKAEGVAVTVETVDSLNGDSIDETAVRIAKRLGHNGIFVLIAKQEHKAEVLAAPRSLYEELGKVRINEIRDAFTDEFRKGKIDDGLTKGVEAAHRVLATRASAGSGRPVGSGAGFLPATTGHPEGASGAGTSPLILRQQVRLTLAGARKVIEGAEARAAHEGWKMNIAVVDDGGHMIAFERMDGARPASVTTATNKAISAATYRQASGPILSGGPTPVPGDVLLNIGVQNAAGGKFTSLLGGIPIVVDGQIIGAVGVGGGTGEQDADVARSGVAAFLEGLKVTTEPEKPAPKDVEVKDDASTIRRPGPPESPAPK